MAVFLYSALRTDGTKADGEVEAADRSSAFRRLDRQGLQPISLKPKAGAAAAPAKSESSKKNGAKPAGTSAAPGRGKAKSSAPPAKGKGKGKAKDKVDTAPTTGPVKLKRAQILLFTEELSDLLSAGLQLEPALKIMESRDELSALKIVTQILRQQVRDGSSFSNALRAASPSFGDLYCSLAAAGEISGALPTILKRQAKYLITITELQSKVMFALIYPSFLVASGIAVCVLFVTFLIPQLADLLKSMDKELPLAAKVMQAFGSFFSGYWWLIGLVIIFSVWMFKRVTTTEPYNKPWDRVKLNLPLMGAVLRMRFYVQFLETLSNLVGNGLPLLRALELTRDATQNLYLNDVVGEAIDSVREGASLSKTLRRVGSFPPLLTDMITVGEETGDLPLALDRAAQRYDKELQKKIDKVSALIQPVIVVIMAVIVGTMAYMMITVILESIAGMKG